MAVEYVLGSMLDADLCRATHVYVSSLCMGDALMARLWSKLRAVADEHGRLQLVASLREFGGGDAASALVGDAAVQMSWNRRGGEYTPVFVYRLQPR